jgi:hypothetical protein
MITINKTKLLFALTAFCVFSAVYGQQDDKPKPQLWFEVASGTIKIPEDFPEIKYIGQFNIINDRDLGPWIWAVSTTSKWKEMSEKQRQFILKLENDYKYRSIVKKKRTGYPFVANSDYVKTPEGTKTYRVYAVSKEDARKMAEAVIEWHNNNARLGLEFEKKRLQENLEIITEAQATIPKLEKEYKKLETKTEQIMEEYAKTNYKIDSLDENMIYDHIKKSMEELASYLRQANFELIGLQARMDSIELFKTSGKISDPGTMIKLDQMLIADEIERAGVLARKKAYEASFKQTEELYSIIRSRDDAAIQKRKWQDNLEKAQKLTSQLERELANPRRGMLPVEIYENKVTIWQARQD